MEGKKIGYDAKRAAQNRTGLLVDLSHIFSDRGIDISSINLRTSKQGMATIEMMFDVGSRDELMDLMRKIRQVDGVMDVERDTG